MDGRIFDIQRFSIYDGPGIRTNVFLKGCNLRCKWCHNPESQRMANDLLFYREKCVGCGACKAVCDKAFTPACTGCGKCAEVCRHGAREISGRTVSADEVVGKVLRDRRFYKTSGGGVTLTGGEPLLQPDFAAEILEKCKAAGLHTAVETAGNVPWSTFERVLPYLDLVLFDLKSLDEQTFLAVFDGVPTFAIDRSKLPLGILDLLAVETSVFPSKGEARKMIQANGFSLNKEKLTDPQTPITAERLLNDKYLLFQKGKKNYYLIVAE